jgi:hypothetical protein
MNYLKLFENNYTVTSIRNMIVDYVKFIQLVEPYIIEIYRKLAKDDDYEPNYGDVPYGGINYEFLSLTHIGYTKDELQFVLQLYNDNGEVVSSFYIDVTNDELEKLLLEIDSKKYNI